MDQSVDQSSPPASSSPDEPGTDAQRLRGWSRLKLCHHSAGYDAIATGIRGTGKPWAESTSAMVRLLSKYTCQ